MKIKLLPSLIFTVLFLASRVFASSFYFLKNENSPMQLIGDSEFSYSFTRFDTTNSRETFEENLMRVVIDRPGASGLLHIERKTKFGILILDFENSDKNWKNVKVSFHPYLNYYKDNAENCGVLPTEKNRNDLSSISKNLSNQNFKNLFFEENCVRNLSDKEFQEFTQSIYMLLGDEQENISFFKEPKSLSCLSAKARMNPFKRNFQELREKVLLAIKAGTDPEEIVRNNMLPLPLSCDFDGKAQKKCGILKEGLKSKISIDVKCLKQGPLSLTVKAQGIFLHEFMHTIREPKVMTEKQIEKIDQGICDSDEAGVTFLTPGEVDLSKEKVVAKLNSDQTGATMISGDVVNPYSSFVERSGTAASSVANNGTSATVRRNVASANFALNSQNSSPSVNTEIPTLPSAAQAAQYQAVKGYVGASVGVIAKKIAPLVSYVESPAFAATLPKVVPGTSATNAVTTQDVSNEIGHAGGATGGAPSGKSSEVGSSSSSSGKTNAGLGGSAGGNQAATVNKSASRSTASDPNLDNAYALKIRKRLLSDESFRNQLRRDGVQILFADKYRFESPQPKVQYVEKNGVLVRGN